MPEDHYVQFGCGQCAPSNWINFDASPRVAANSIPVLGRLFANASNVFPASVKYGNIVKGLPLPDNSCAVIYSSHVLEHLSLDECRQALRNVYKLLTPGGCFRLVIPDLEVYVDQYKQNTNSDACSEFMRATLLGAEVSSNGIGNRLREWLGHSQHLWMWDYKGLEKELQKTNFTGIRRAQFGDSEIARFREVEQPERWHHALGIECRK